jgi:hypothetical protein
MNRTAAPHCILAALLLAAGAAQAQAAPGAGTFRCGGIGDAEQRQFKAEAANHDLFVTFASDRGAYVAGVDVRIISGAGAPVLQGRCEGPLMLVDLPGPGRYEVEAGFEGRTQRKSVTAGRKGTPLSFSWSRP